MQQSIQEEIYFFSAGEVSGPYSHQDVLALEKKGGLESFDWMWVSAEPEWVAVDESREDTLCEKPELSPAMLLRTDEADENAEEDSAESIDADVRDDTALESVAGTGVKGAFCNIAGRALKGFVRSKNALGLQFSVDKNSYPSTFPIGVQVDMVSFSSADQNASVKTLHLADCVDNDDCWILYLRKNI